MNATSRLLHATSVRLHGMGVLIIGKPGSGKSSLALQLMVLHGATLIADDQTRLRKKGQKLLAAAPRVTRNKLELRGWGIVPVKAAKREVPIALVVELVKTDLIERHPDSQELKTEIFGVALPCLRLDANIPAASSRISFLARHLKQA